jgi:aryl-alcohol dehydrogenase-like predicted oxidoreductase
MQQAEWNEIRTSMLGFGCASVMGRVGRRASLEAMNAAWDAGITFFDTARSYGYGEAEGLLGEFLAGRREQATIITKFGILPVRTAAWKRLAKPIVRGVLKVLPQTRQLVRQGLTAQASAGHFDVATLRDSLEESLRQLRTDYVDILLAHEAPASIMAQDDLIAALETIVREGKARRAGVACAGRDAVLIAAQGPPVLSVLQYPALAISDWPAGVWDDRLRIVNHVFGGPSMAARSRKLLTAMATDRRVDPALREKLRGDPHQVLAAFCITRARLRSRPHLLLASMFQPKHLQANIAALSDDRFSAADVAQIMQCFTANGLFR